MTSGSYRYSHATSYCSGHELSLQPDGPVGDYGNWGCAALINGGVYQKSLAVGDNGARHRQIGKQRVGGRRVPRAPGAGETRRAPTTLTEAPLCMATMRSRRVSRALYTSPIPPAPMGARISYGPSRMPMPRDIGCKYTWGSAVASRGRSRIRGRLPGNTPSRLPAKR